MTRLARRALLLVAFSLLTSAATAYAECAWVLWQEGQEEHGPYRPWGMQSAFPTYERCVTAAREHAESWAVAHRYMRSADADYVMTEATMDGGWAMFVRGSRQMQAKCLPDTVDPRGPKGK